jgi:hypothetical protein
MSEASRCSRLDGTREGDPDPEPNLGGRWRFEGDPDPEPN